MNKNYVKNLEDLLARILSPLKDAPFQVIIKSISGCSVLPFNYHRELMKLINKALTMTGEKINKKGISKERSNEVGNKIESFIKESFNKFGLNADTPTNKKGKKISSGYPDIIFEYAKKSYYLECKTYNLKNINTTQRSFYFSPSRSFKITKDAPHLMVSFEVNKKGKKYFVNHWKLYSLEKLKVDLKHEFNQNNKNIYGDDSTINLIAEADIK